METERRRSCVTCATVGGIGANVKDTTSKARQATATLDMLSANPVASGFPIPLNQEVVHLLPSGKPKSIRY